MSDRPNTPRPAPQWVRSAGLLVVVIGLLAVICGSCTILLLALPGVRLGPEN